MVGRKKGSFLPLRKEDPGHETSSRDGRRREKTEIEERPPRKKGEYRYEVREEDGIRGEIEG